MQSGLFFGYHYLYRYTTGNKKDEIQWMPEIEKAKEKVHDASNGYKQCIFF
jgi:hypothetical protein